MQNLFLDFLKNRFGLMKNVQASHKQVLLLAYATLSNMTS